MKVNGVHYRTVWMENGKLFMIDQNKLPFAFEVAEILNHLKTAAAIKDMTVRGAGAIGAAAGFGMAQAFVESSDKNHLEKARAVLEASRPTAQNLFWAVKRVYRSGLEGGPKAAIDEAQRIADEDVASCKAIGDHGSQLLEDGMRVMTHCNAGWLAFVDYGSATAPMYRAKEEGNKIHIFVSRTGPRDQGARLTAWELGNAGVSHEIIDDNAAGHLMRKGEVDIVIVGADRIAVNGDVANKIGTYMKAVVAKENGVPFYVAAPLSTFDMKCHSGEMIPIEERSEDEVLYKSGPDEKGEIRKILVASPGSKARNPSFDVTPARYITGLITPNGIIKPKINAIRKLFA